MSARLIITSTKIISRFRASISHSATPGATLRAATLSINSTWGAKEFSAADQRSDADRVSGGGIQSLQSDQFSGRQSGSLQRGVRTIRSTFPARQLQFALKLYF